MNSDWSWDLSGRSDTHTWHTLWESAPTRTNIFGCKRSSTAVDQRISNTKPLRSLQRIEGSVTDLWIERHDEWHFLSYLHLSISPLPSCENKVCLLQMMAYCQAPPFGESVSCREKGNKDNNGSREKTGKVPITSGRTGSFPLAVLLECESDTPGASVVQRHLNNKQRSNGPGLAHWPNLNMCHAHKFIFVCLLLSECFQPYIKDYSQFVSADRAIWYGTDWNVNKNAPEGDGV